LRIAIFGTGGAGGYFGARLARAGEDVVFIARGEHLRAIRERGLRVETDEGDVLVQPARATDDPARAGEVDVVVVGVKTWQLEDAAHSMRPMMGAGTFAVPLQNGVEAASLLASVLGPQRVLDGLCGTISWVAGPGHIRSIGQINFVRFGEPDNRPSERAESLRAVFGRAGVKAEIPSDIRRAVWEKFLFVTPYGGVGAATRAPAGVLRTVPETRRLLEGSVAEVSAVGRAKGVHLPEGLVAKSMAMVDSLAPDATTSLQRDIAAGRPSELDAWTGAVVRLGREAGVATPLNGCIHACLLPLERRARGELDFPG
jgi:2-dehydropantoate 2-reductase